METQAPFSLPSFDIPLATLSVTVALYHVAMRCFMSLDTKKDVESLKHLATDFAMTPMRLVLAWLSFPILAQCFYPNPRWTQDDVDNSIVAWITLSAGYAFDMWYTKTNVMGLVHHCIAFGFTIYSVLKMSDASESHALSHRYQAAELFFAISIGGMFSTATRLLYLFIGSEQARAPTLCRNLISIFTWSLTLVISLGWTFKTIFIHQNAEVFYQYFGPIPSAIVLAAIAVIYGVQYKWIFMWGAKADRLSQKAGKVRNLNRFLRKTPLRSVFAGLTLGIADFGRLYVQCSRAI